jgi:hypothetical protein
MSNPRRTGPPTRQTSSSNSASGHYSTQTPAHNEEPENPLPFFVLSHSARGSGGSSEQFQPQFLSSIPHELLEAEPQTFDLGQLPGYGFPPGGPLVLGNPNPNQAQAGGGGSGSGFGTYFEPQGELHAQLEAQFPAQHDFVTPTPLLRRATNSFSKQSNSFGDSGRGTGMIAATRTFSSAEMSRRGQAAPSVTTRSGQKRKADSLSDERRESQTMSPTRTAPASPELRRHSAARPAPIRAEQSSPRVTRSSQQAPESEADGDDDDDEGQDRQTQTAESDTRIAPPKLKQSDSSEARRVVEMAPHLTTVLPAGKVFPIQIGSELFRLSGASISSDGRCDSNSRKERLY